MAQLQAAFYTDHLYNFWQKHVDKEKVEGLLQLLSRFEVDLPRPSKNTRSFHPVLSVAKNLIVRGVPTRASIAVEDVLADILGRTTKTITNGSIAFKANSLNENFETALYRALHVIDPRIQNADQFEPLGKWEGKSDVNYEDSFFDSILPTFYGKHLMQLVQVKRKANAILKNKKAVNSDFLRLYKDSEAQLASEVIDFTFEMPFKIKGKKGILVQFDDVDHSTYPRRELDQSIDEAVFNEGWEKTIHIDEERYEDISKHLTPLGKFTSTGYYDFHKQNIDYPLYRTEEGMDALQLALTPIGIARLQRTILELLKNNNLSLYDNEWHFAIIERDIPCAQLAMLDFHQLLQNLFVLHGEGLQDTNMATVPDIKLEVFHTADFDSAKLNNAVPGSKLLDAFDSEACYDAIFDISLLQRTGIKNIVPPNKAQQIISIRSAHAIESQANFDIREPIDYHSILTSLPNGKKIVHPKSRTALNYFTQSIFRKSELRPKQFDVLDSVLQRNNTAALLPPNSGKSLVYQLATLLQTSPSIIITPLTTLAKNQMDKLWENGIERLHWINSARNTTQELDNALVQFESRQALFQFVAPEWFRKTALRASIAHVLEKNGDFSYCIIDEVHSASEWSHDFRQEYFKLPNLIKKLLPNTALIGLSGTAFNNTLFDIQSDLSVEPNNTISDILDPQKFHSKVELIELPKTRSSAILSLAKDALATKKQVRALTWASNLSKKSESAFFFTPYNKGTLGITDENNDGLADKLRLSFGKSKVAAFIGTDKNYTNSETEEVETKYVNESKEAYNSVVLNDAKIIVSSSALSVGIDSDCFDNIIHLNMPSSIEGFVQKNGRGNRKDKSSNSVILYNNQKFTRKQEEVLIDKTGRETLQTTEVETTIDKQIIHDFFYSRFRGRKFDLMSLIELLDEISWPDFYPEKELKRILEKKYQHSFSFLGDTSDPDIEKLLVFANQNNFALFRIEEEINYTQLNYDIEEADAILADIKAYFNVKTSISKLSWFFSCIQRTKKAGIEKALNDFENSQKIFKEHENPQLTIPFENDRIDRITQLLNEHSSDKFTTNLVLTAFQYANSASEFIFKLHKTANIQIITEGINLPEKLTELFYQIRRRENTMTAIRQLSTLGVVEDYLIDEEQKVLEVTLSPVSNEYFVIALHRYIQRYVHKAQAYNVFNDIYKYSAPSTLRKCIRYLIDFVYDEIAPSRFNSIQAIANACEEIINPETVEGDITFGDLVGLHLQAKYAHPSHEPNIISDTNNFTKYEYHILKKYISVTGKKRENWYHLKGSSETLLKGQPDNYLLLMLKAYSKFSLVPKNIDSLDSSLTTLVYGLNIARRKENWTPEQWNEKVIEIASWITAAIPGLNHLSKNIALKIHLVWLKQFKHKFLEGYQ